jgi:rubrerythrin
VLVPVRYRQPVRVHEQQALRKSHQRLSQEVLTMGKKDKEDPPLAYVCGKCGTKYARAEDALACGCRRKDESD